MTRSLVRPECLKSCDKSPNHALWVECGGENESGQTM